MGYVILGAGGHSKVVIDTIRCMEMINMESLSEIRLLDDNLDVETKINGCRVVGKLCNCYKFLEGNKFIIGVGNNSVRRLIAETYLLPYAVAVHPDAILGSGVSIGNGSVIMAGVVINAETSIGEHCIINTGSTLDHENTIDDFVHISPGVHTGGNVRVGKESWIGIGSCVKNGVTLGEQCVVGAGSVVLKNIPSGYVAVGCPARPMKNMSRGKVK